MRSGSSIQHLGCSSPSAEILTPKQRFLWRWLQKTKLLAVALACLPAFPFGIGYLSMEPYIHPEHSKQEVVEAESWHNSPEAVGGPWPDLVLALWRTPCFGAPICSSPRQGLCSTKQDGESLQMICWLTSWRLVGPFWRTKEPHWWAERAALRSVASCTMGQ